jgi:hypothetical protein
VETAPATESPPISTAVSKAKGAHAPFALHWKGPLGSECLVTYPTTPNTDRRAKPDLSQNSP